MMLFFLSSVSVGIMTNLKS
ncbi:hypothetical protein NXF25_002022 [Crotalus adamanteus]|uniref:Uncharacterized protein n=1 Tax=Crotalus adamanteus TaxID=8729 RepID=A0AAW1CAQ9_CROAD